MGLTDKGYVKRSYDDILSDMINRAREMFGEDIDTSDQTIFGKLLRLIAYDQAQYEEEQEAVYYATFPHTASGQNLDRLMPLGAMSRNPATPALYSVEFFGTAGFVIEVGTEVCTDNGLVLYTVEEATIGDGGSCLVTVESTVAGSSGNVSASAIRQLVNPNASISSVAGRECLSPGVDTESDTALRTRFDASVAGSGSCNANAIRAALMRIPTVKFADVIENETDEVDSDGRPPHSFECYVLGGDDYVQQIAETIFDKRPIGIRAVGDIELSVTADNGAEQIVRYSTALHVMVTIRIVLKTDATFPADGVSQVQASVADYINGLGIGKSLVLSKVYEHVYKVTGAVEATALESSTDGGSTYSESNVAVPQYGVAVCAAVNVEVADA